MSLAVSPLHGGLPWVTVSSTEEKSMGCPHCFTVCRTQGHLCFMKVKTKVKSLSCVQLFVTPWTVAYQAPLSMEFPRQEYWSGLPFPSPGDLPDPGIEPRSPTLQADALPSELPGKPCFMKLNGIHQEEFRLQKDCDTRAQICPLPHPHT